MVMTESFHRQPGHLHLMPCAVLSVGERPFIRLHLARLVVIGVVAGERSSGLEVAHVLVVEDGAVGVEVAKVELPPLLVAATAAGAAEAAIRREPAPGFGIKPGPVVAARVARGGVEAALPAGRDARDAAQRDKQQGLQAAVAPQVDRRILRAVFNQLIGPDVAVEHPARDEVIKALGLAHGHDLVADQLLAQRYQIGREQDVRGLGLQVLPPGGFGIGVEYAGGGIVHRVAVIKGLHIA